MSARRKDVNEFNELLWASSAKVEDTVVQFRGVAAELASGQRSNARASSARGILHRGVGMEGALATRSRTQVDERERGLPLVPPRPYRGAFVLVFSLLLFMRGCFSRPGADVCVESFVYVRVCVRVCRLTTVWALAFFRVVECSARRV